MTTVVKYLFRGALLGVVAWSSAWTQTTRTVPLCLKFDQAYFRWTGTAPATTTTSSSAQRDSARTIRLDPTPAASSTRQELSLRPISYTGSTSVTPDSSWLRHSYWEFTSGDSVEIRWTRGLDSPILRVSLHGDTLRGRFELVSDALMMTMRTGATIAPGITSRPAWAVPVACPTTAPR
jgi:hypothetical protein